MVFRYRLRYIVSACLAGVNCNHKGGNSIKRPVMDIVEKGMALAVCPEMLGGLSAPRESAEIIGGDGMDVLKKRAVVLTASGKDVTSNYIKGARKALSIAKRYGISRAILKSKSPSCGYGRIYDGMFRGNLRKGNGVLTSLLVSNNFRITKER